MNKQKIGWQEKFLKFMQLPYEEEEASFSTEDLNFNTKKGEKILLKLSFDSLIEEKEQRRVKNLCKSFGPSRKGIKDVNDTINHAIYGNHVVFGGNELIGDIKSISSENPKEKIFAIKFIPKVCHKS